MASIFSNRIREIANRFNTESLSSALLVGSNPLRAKSADSSFTYHPNTDLFYLSGSSAENLLLLVLPGKNKSVLFAKPFDAVHALWHGKPPNFAKLARELGIDLVVTKDTRKEVKSRLRGIERLFYQNISESESWQITREIMELPWFSRGTLPSRFHHASLLIDEMRLFKDPEEVKAIQLAASVTNSALVSALPLIKAGQSEASIAAAIEFGFGLHEATPGFESIVASGQNAATLHHTASIRKLKNGELVLLDVGARLQMYSGDISRTLPVSGRFSEVQARVYEAVLYAQKETTKKIKHGMLISKLEEINGSALLDGLIDLGVLRGKKSALFAKKAWKTFCPHSVGHHLGLDVHDYGKRHPSNMLKSGMVYTIEPGLYFPKGHGKIPALGIRIEDDVLITEKGCNLLSEGFPKEIEEIEALMNS